MRFLNPAALGVAVLLVFVLGAASMAAAAEEPSTGPHEHRLARVEATDLEPSPVAREQDRIDAPGYLRGATVFNKLARGAKASNEIEFEVKEGGVLLLAAAWTQEGNIKESWWTTRQTPSDLMQHGWIPIARMWSNENGIPARRYVVFLSHARAGQRLKFHTGRKHPPRLVLPAREQLADVVAATPLVDDQGNLKRMPVTAGGLVESDLKKLDQASKNAPPSQLSRANLQLGWHLKQKGTSKLADQRFLKTMEFPVMYNRTRTLAGAMLLEHGLTPDAYRDAIQRKREVDESLPREDRRQPAVRRDAENQQRTNRQEIKRPPRRRGRNLGRPDVGKPTSGYQYDAL